MLSEEDIFSIGKSYTEKRADGMGPVGWGALGGAGLGLLNHWLRPKDNDDRGIGSALLSVLTGAGLGATAGLAYKSLGSNPFDPGPSQEPRTAPTTPAPSEEFMNDLDEIGRAYGETVGAPEGNQNKKNITITPVGGTTGQPSPEEAAAIAATVGRQPTGNPASASVGNGAQPVGGVATAPAEASMVQDATQQPVQKQESQDTNKEQAANKKEQKEIKPFVPSDENAVKYSMYAAAHPEKLTKTWDDLKAEMSPVPPIIPIPGTNKNMFKPGVPFIMTDDVAFKRSPSDDALLDPQANFSRTIREKLDVAVNNKWLCVADKKGAVYPIIKVNGGFMGAFLDPVFDPAQNGFFPSMVRETGAFLGRAGNAAVEAATPVVQDAADEVSGSFGTALDFYRQKLGL